MGEEKMKTVYDRKNAPGEEFIMMSRREAAVLVIELTAYLAGVHGWARDPIPVGTDGFFMEYEEDTDRGSHRIFFFLDPKERDWRVQRDYFMDGDGI